MRKIMIIRHAEKPVHGGPDRSVCIDGFHAKHELTVRGWQRAAALVHVFAPRNGEPHHPGLAPPRTIFAAAATMLSPSLRSQRTVEPLAAALGLPVDTTHAEGEEAALAAAALAAPSPVLVAWHHHRIADIARLIGAEASTAGLGNWPAGSLAGSPAGWPTDWPTDWPDDRYDMVWVLDGEPCSGWTLTQVPQLVFPHDRSDPL